MTQRDLSRRLHFNQGAIIDLDYMEIEEMQSMVQVTTASVEFFGSEEDRFSTTFGSIARNAGALDAF